MKSFWENQQYLGLDKNRTFSHEGKGVFTKEQG